MTFKAVKVKTPGTKKGAVSVQTPSDTPSKVTQPVKGPKIQQPKETPAPTKNNGRQK